MTSRTTESGNESATTKLESDALCTKKVRPLLFSTIKRVSPELQEQQEPTTHRGSKFEDILTLMKDAIE